MLWCSPVGGFYMHSKAICRLALFTLILWPQVRCSVVALPACSAAAGGLEHDCFFTRGTRGINSLRGRLGTPGGPPALIRDESGDQSGSTAGPSSSLDLAYVLLVGFKLPAPSDPAGLIPVGLLSSSGSVALRDVRILVDRGTLQQHVEYFRALPAVKVYTDGASFLHVNYHATARATWKSVGLLLAADLQAARSTSTPRNSSIGRHPLAATGAAGSAADEQPAARPGYVLAATNNTIVPLMQQLGAVDGPATLLMYIDTNVTLSKPPVPAAGIVVNRPLVLVGLTVANVSVDLHMDINTIILTAPDSNITVDSVVVENEAPGDARSAEVARPLSVSSANNMWALYYDRSQSRLLIRNSTIVLGSQTELDYYLYWATVYHSSLPYFKELAKFIREVIHMTEWQLGDPSQGDNKSVLVEKSIAGSCTIEDSTYTVTPYVAPKLPSPRLDPALQLQQSQKSPLVTAVSNVAALRKQILPLGAAEAGRTHVVLLRTNMTFPPAESDVPPTGSATPPGGVPVPDPLTLLGDFSESKLCALSLNFRRDLLTLPDNAPAGHFQIQHLVLRGLAQGPGAAAAAGLDVPDVWTFMLWAVRRTSASSITLSACVLELPPQEFQQLRQLAVDGSGQIVLKLSRDMRGPAGDGLLVFNDMDTSSTGSMRVGSLTGHGLAGTNLTLVASTAAAAIPGGYWWPGGGISSEPHGRSGQLPGSQLAAAIAVPLAVLAAAGAVAAVLLTRQRRQQRQRQQRDLEKALFCDDLLPAHRNSSGSVCPSCQHLSGGDSSSSDTFGRKGPQQASSGSLCCNHQGSASGAACSGAGSSSDNAVQHDVACGPAGAVAAGCNIELSASRKKRTRRVSWRLDDLEPAFKKDQSSNKDAEAATAAAAAANDCRSAASAGAESDMLSEQQQQQQQLRQQGLDLLRAWPRGTSGLQDSSPASYHTSLAASSHQARPDTQAGPGEQAVPAAAWASHADGQSHSQPYAGFGAGGSDHRESSEPMSQPLFGQLNCEYAVFYGGPLHPGWHMAQQAAEAAGCSVQDGPAQAGQQPQAHSSQELQQQQPSSAHAPNSQTLFLTMDSASAVAAGAAEELHRRPQQQGPTRTGGVSGAQTCSDSVSSTGVFSAQQQVVLQREGACLDTTATAPASAGLAGAVPVAATAVEPAVVASTAATIKPWQRVSTAISLLQHGITVRRLEAGLTGSQTSSSGSGSAGAADAGQQAAGAQGAAVGTVSGPQQQQQQCRESAALQQTQQLQLLDIVGRGTFASVYRAIWRGRCVAVKVVQLPGEGTDGSNGGLVAALQTRERMAVMEAVISVTMSHPNIVQVYTFGLKPLPTALVSGSFAEPGQQQRHQGTANAKASGWELQLIMEYCEEGSLRQALNQGRLTDPNSSGDLPTLHLVLALAHDVACAMLHLHSENLIHADLKASNVLLTRGTAPVTTTSSGSSAVALAAAVAAQAAHTSSSGSGAAAQRGSDRSRGGSISSRLSCAALIEAAQASGAGRLIAKVADFGLSLSLNPGDTHVSHMHAGTLTHMAPELLLHGRASPASDTYAFGILFWELLTGRRAFLGVPVALLGHNVVHLRWRPDWPPGVPPAVKLLVEQCWAQEPGSRPSFQKILLRLEHLMQLSPEDMLRPSCVEEQQQQQQQQVDGIAAVEMLVGTEAGVFHQQQQEQEEQQRQQLRHGFGAAAAAGPGAAGDDLTGAWSLPGAAQKNVSERNKLA